MIAAIMKPASFATIVVLILIFLCPITARADMVTPGFKRIDQRVIFDNLDQYPDFAFFLTCTKLLEDKGSPKFRLSQGEVVTLGYAVRFRYDWQVVAVPRREVERAGPTADLEGLAKDSTGLLRSNTFQFPDYESALVVSPKQYNLHRFHIDITDGKLTTQLVSVTSVGSGDTWTWLVGIVITLAVASLGIWWVRRRKMSKLNIQPSRSSC